MKTNTASVVTKERISPIRGDNCRKRGVRYTNVGGRSVDEPKLNFRFHNSNTPEELTKILLRVCIDANMKKVEAAIKQAIDDNPIRSAKDENRGVLQSID